VQREGCGILRFAYAMKNIKKGFRMLIERQEKIKGDCENRETHLIF